MYIYNIYNIYNIYIYIYYMYMYVYYRVQDIFVSLSIYVHAYLLKELKSFM